MAVTVPRRAPLIAAFAVMLSVAAGLTIPTWALTGRSALGLVALVLAALIWKNASDRTAPHVLFPAIWFLGVCAAQFPVIGNYNTPWTADMTFIAFAAPVAFAGSSLALSSRVKRLPATMRWPLATNRLLRAIVVLFAFGVAGLVLKSKLVGGIPILSDKIDTTRSAGGIKVPFYITFLTDGMVLGTWLSLMRAAALKQAGCGMALSLALALFGLAGVSFSASRNALLLALAVPIVFAYLSGWLRRITGRRAVLGVAGGTLLMVVASGLFFLRTSQHSTSRFESYFYGQVVQETPLALRPLLPLYVGLATPMETLNRLTAVPPRREYTQSPGFYSLPGIPRQVNPFGPAAQFYDVTAGLSSPYYFNVATFAGSPYADGRVLGVVLASLLLGLGFGISRWWLLSRPTVVRVAIGSYLAYLAGFLFYEDVLTFYTLSVVWDVLILAVALTYCSRGTEARGWQQARDGLPDGEKAEPIAARPDPTPNA